LLGRGEKEVRLTFSRYKKTLKRPCVNIPDIRTLVGKKEKEDEGGGIRAELQQ
jgi:hypothetical protein